MRTMRTTTATMKIEAFAKINLTLEVFGVRTDGYHALRSVVVPVSLSDTIEIEDAVSLSSDVPYPDDLCLKAARVLLGLRGGCGAAISVIKRIPAGGGLGGGSADAAATLLALNDLWGHMLSRDELVEIAAQVGSDVPSLVAGGPVLMEGRGERVTRFVSDAIGNLSFVLANPGISVSTPAVFARSPARPADDSSVLDSLRSALDSGELGRIAASFVNDLTAPACAMHPEISDALASLRTAGVLGASMSGSGSTVFGLVPDAARGDEIAACLNAKGLRAWSVHTVV